MAGLFKFVSDQLFVGLPKPTTSFANQTIIVTGSNVGLGLEASRHFTRLGAAKVILAVRNADKGNAAKTSIEESTNTSGKGIVEVWPLDLSRYSSVQDFAARASKLDRLDALVENAGIANPKYEVLEDNESTITVNVISTYLLALLLLPKLRETSRRYHDSPRPPHLVIVSSEVHFWSQFTEQSAPDGHIFSTLNHQSTANMPDRYNVSKLLEVFLSRELAARAPLSQSEGKGKVVINFLNPGFCHSELTRDISSWGMRLLKLLLARTTEQGSRTLVHAAAAGEESHGQYLGNCRVEHVAPLVSKDGEGGGKLQKRVWYEVVAKLEAIQEGVARGL